MHHIIKSQNINYDAAGRIVSSLSAANHQVDLSFLKKGNYVFKIFTKNDYTVKKIIKK